MKTVVKKVLSVLASVSWSEDLRPGNQVSFSDPERNSVQNIQQDQVLRSAAGPQQSQGIGGRVAGNMLNGKRLEHVYHPWLNLSKCMPSWEEGPTAS